MYWYYYIALAAIFSQILFFILMLRNYLFVMDKYKKRRVSYRPRTILIVPCKGLESTFQENITSFLNQDYENYLLWFVVADEADPAYPELCKLKHSMSQSSNADDVQIQVAGQTQSCSQKIHNLLYCCLRIPDDVEVLAFADSDISVRNDWLSQIVHPLRKSKNGVASGYRWFVPKKNNLASLALSAVNAKIAQLLGNSPFNQVWGGSMAIRVDVFRNLELDKIWAKALSDDLSLSYAVKKAHKKVAFVPASLVASYESTTWKKLFEFGRRQFLITRVSLPKTWWFGLCICLYSILGLWGGAAMAVYIAKIGDKNLLFFIAAAVPVFFFASQTGRAILRQKMIRKLLKHDHQKMTLASSVDIVFSWLWSFLLLFFIISSAFGRTITWRGIRYKLLGPTETIVINNEGGE